jgi:hypothetical protein
MGDRDGATPEVRHGLCSGGQQHHANVALTGAYELRLIVGNLHGSEERCAFQLIATTESS